MCFTKKTTKYHTKNKYKIKNKKTLTNAQQQPTQIIATRQTEIIKHTNQQT